MKGSPDILSFCYGGFPGTNRALSELSQTIRLSRHFTLTSASGKSREIAFFRKYLLEVPPRLVILGSWVPAYEVLLDGGSQNDVRFAVQWSSSPGQVGLSGETALLARLMADPRISFLLFASRYFPAILKGHGKHYFELLDTLAMPDVPVSLRKMPRAPGETTVVSLFCGPNEYARKNVVTALLALSGLEREYVLYVNGLSEDDDYKLLLDALGVPYRDHGWMEADDYERTLGQIDVGVQASFSESYNYVVADHICNGVPALVSRMVPIMDEMPAAVRERLVVQNADDPFELREALAYLVDHPAETRDLGKVAFEHLKTINDRRIAQARETLQDILDLCD